MCCCTLGNLLSEAASGCGTQAQRADGMQSGLIRADADVHQQLDDLCYWQSSRKPAESYFYHTTELRIKYLAQKRENFPFHDWNCDPNQSANINYWECYCDRQVRQDLIEVNIGAQCSECGEGHVPGGPWAGGQVETRLWRPVEARLSAQLSEGGAGHHEVAMLSRQAAMRQAYGCLLG